ncbi:hypothetical protein WN48_11146 [Eufriesea mexicana]|uniref:Uncharacterized protein n=1 Tax=Eufriesea mexicana TaxID=516756 RepID=A0A310SH52_9HYME|nr:PREDICTED: uncharacterized protein LOC108553213 [Eufriesea mexicana]OAD52900.1 hypothetical protein WN48_11146 [Eufriesea mexicana]
MGNYVNKFFTYNTESRSNEIEKEEMKAPTSTNKLSVDEDMQTPPIIHKTLLMDPRSVTNGISRTPIEINTPSTPIGLSRKILSIPKHLQSKPYLETDIDKIMLCLTPKKCVMPNVIEIPKQQDKGGQTHLTPINSKKIISAIEKERYEILGLDPRSPAADFDRTPILMPKSIERLRARSRECLHRRGSYDTDIFYPKFVYCEMSSQFNVTEVQALPDLTTSVAKSLNLISDCHDKSSEPESPCSSQSSRTECTSEIGNNELEDQDEFQNISEQDNSNDILAERDTEQKKMCATDNDIIKVWRDSILLENPQKSEINESNNTEDVEKNISQIAKEEVIITFDDSIVKDTLSLKLANSESEKTRVNTITKKKISKLEGRTAADEKKLFHSNEKNGSEFTKVRTPFGNRSNNGQMQTFSTNSPQQVFKNKGITPKMLQENTPPHKKYVAKAKLSGIQWDSDSTVII